MLKVLTARWIQGKRTIDHPGPVPRMPDRFRGLPRVDWKKCPPGCHACADACPTGARCCGDAPSLDLGRCLFCASCASHCAKEAVVFSLEHRLAARTRENLVFSPRREVLPELEPLEPARRKLFRRSLKLRQVSAGGCNACEADVNVLNTVVFDLGRFGVSFVASPRHADGILVTGPVTQNMKKALLKTWEAIPSPKLVIAAGSCAISGGPYAGHPEANDGVGSLLPVDLYIPGCPPHPLTTLDAILGLLGRL